MTMQIFELLNVMDKEFRHLWINELLKDNYQLQKLQLEINSNNEPWISEVGLKNMLSHYNIEFQGNLCNSFNKIPIKFNRDIPVLFKPENISKRFLSLITKLSHTNQHYKIYNLLYEYFSRVRDPMSIKWSIEILTNKNKLKNILD